MTDHKEISHITPVGGNVFADLGFEVDEAEALKAQAQRRMEEKLALKREMMKELTVWMEVKHLKQSEAAEVLGVTRPRISDVKRQQTQKFSLDALSDMLMRAGKKVQLTVS